MENPRISIIIPSLHDGEYLKVHLPPLLGDPRWEVLVVESGTLKKDLKGVRYIKSPKANRAFQMNLGAAKARGNILLFLHADTHIHPSSLPQLDRILRRKKKLAGGFYRFALDHPSWRARLMEIGVVLRELFFRLSYGDQAIFIRKNVFNTIGGYPEVPILEDVLLVNKLREQGKLLYFERVATTSARKWEQVGFFRMMLINWATMLKWRTGAPLEDLAQIRNRLFLNA